MFLCKHAKGFDTRTEMQTKLINSLTGNVSNIGGGAAFGGGLDSPRMSDSPASDYLRQNSSGLSSKHKVRGNHHPRSQSRTPIDPSGGAGLDASAHLLSKLNELAQGGQENGFIERHYLLQLDRLIFGQYDKMSSKRS